MNTFAMCLSPVSRSQIVSLALQLLLSFWACAAPVQVQETWELGQGRERIVDPGMWGCGIFSAKGDKYDWYLSSWGICYGWEEDPKKGRTCGFEVGTI